jgi:hypothetical protein
MRGERRAGYIGAAPLHILLEQIEHHIEAGLAEPLAVEMVVAQPALLQDALGGAMERPLLVLRRDPVEQLHRRHQPSYRADVERGDMVGDPQRRAVGADIAFRDRERAAAVQQRVEALAAYRPVVGMRQRDQVAPDQRVARIAQRVDVTVIRVDDP